MTILKEFREFISRGSVIDLAVGVIIGGAFGTIVKSLVDDIIMPPIGALTKGIAFSDLFFSLDGKHYDSLALAKTATAPVIAYGSFIQATIQFLIVAACIFALVKAINLLHRKQAAAPAATKTETLLTEIRDLLKKE